MIPAQVGAGGTRRVEKEIGGLGMLSERRQDGTLRWGRATQEGMSQHRQYSSVWGPAAWLGSPNTRQALFCRSLCLPVCCWEHWSLLGSC